MAKVFGTAKDIKVTGVTFENRQGKLQYLRQHLDGAYLTLRREPFNAYDENAIKVIAHVPSQKKHFHIGYVPKNTAFWLAKHMDSKRVVCLFNLRITGGWRGKSLGCLFDMSYELTDKQLKATLLQTNKA